MTKGTRAENDDSYSRRGKKRLKILKPFNYLFHGRFLGTHFFSAQEEHPSKTLVF